VFATLLASLLLSLTISSALFMKIVRKKKFFHIDKSFEKGLSDEEQKFLEQERV
jgi:hypothetical protein